MGLFKKKCGHKWKDFPWYLSVNSEKVSYDIYNALLEVTEPYVCVLCGKRKDIVLYSCSQERVSGKIIHIKNSELLEKYGDHIEDRAIVEDMINDTILVDRDFIDAWEAMRQKNKETVARFMDQLMETVPTLEVNE